MTSFDTMTTRDIADLAATVLEDHKVQSLVTLDLHGRCAMADCMLIGTATSQRHAFALASHLQKTFKPLLHQRPPLEGGGVGDWILVDLGPVWVHVMQDHTRSFYALEERWGRPNVQHP